VFDFGTTPSGASYLVMEYLEGEDLDHRLRRTGQQSLVDTIHVVKQVASALAATHGKGVVHRDLKPANLFVLEVEGETDFVKVVDFGISKVRAATTKLTGASAVMGTPNYMSPEQARGQIDEIDHRTDQWSLACIAYEMLTGRGPFVGDSAVSLLYQVIHEEPPSIAKRAPGVPPDVEKVVRRGLAKDMNDRYPTITAFARALEAAGSGAKQPADAKASKRAPNVARVERAPAERPAAQVTTFSNTASEMVSMESELSKGRNKRLMAAAAGAAGLLAIVAIVASRSGKPKSPQIDAEVGAPAPAAAPRPAPIVQPSPVVPAPAPAPPPVVAAPPTTKEPEPVAAPAIAHAPSPASTGSHRTRRTPPGASSTAQGAASSAAVQPAPPPAAKQRWVDPFEQENGTKSGPADSNPSRPAAKPKRRLIEDL
jgi:serine/threonine-protein kinase